jgi:autotransporter-associated beta strand protein
VLENTAYLGARPLASSEYAFNALTANANIAINGGSLVTAGTAISGWLAMTLINSLTFGGSAATGGTLTLELNRILNLDSGGLLATASSTIAAGTMGAGYLNAGSNRELIVHTAGPGVVLTSNVSFGGVSSTNGGFTKSGEGTLILGGSFLNSFTGTTALNLGTLQFGANAPSMNPIVYRFIEPATINNPSGTVRANDFNVNPAPRLI